MMNPNVSKLSAEIRKMARALPRIAGAVARDYFVRTFELQAFDGRSWPARKPVVPNGNKRAPRGRRNLLVQTGTLRRSIKVIALPDLVRVGTDVPYARIHNEGGTISHPGGTPYIFVGKPGKVKRVFIRNTTASRRESEGKYVKRTNPHSITMPQRQFIGNSDALNREIGTAFEAKLKAIIQPFEQ